jgi:hypothetical protein
MATEGGFIGRPRRKIILANRPKGERLSPFSKQACAPLLKIE